MTGLIIIFMYQQARNTGFYPEGGEKNYPRPGLEFAVLYFNKSNYPM